MTSQSLVSARRAWVNARKHEGVEGVFRAQAISLPLPPSFHDAVRVPRAERAVVAEFARKSESGTEFSADDVGAFVAAAERAGACAIAIWPDEEIHGGSYHDILAAAQASPLPVLSRDPVVDPVQVVMARAHGAAAITLDAELLSADELRALYRHAVELGLDVVVEAATATTLERVGSLRLGPGDSSGVRLVGVAVANADGTADVEACEKLAPATPEYAARLCSMQPGASSLDRLDAAGYDAYLTGELLLMGGDVAAAMRSIAGEPVFVSEP